MININDTLLESLNEKELWLLLHLVKRINKDNVCWPSNKTILKDTRWKDERTLAAVKKALIEKGILIQSTRHRTDGSQTANEYTITTDLISVFVTAAKVQQYAANNAGTPLHKMHPPTYTERRGQGVQKTHPHEVLTNEVLTIEGESAPAQFHVQVHSLETIPNVEGEVPRPAARPASKVSELQKNINAHSEAAEHFLRLLQAKGHSLNGAEKYTAAYFLNEQRKGRWASLLIPADAGEEHRWLGEHSPGIIQWAQRQPQFERNNGAQPTPQAAVAPTMRLSNPENAPR